MFAIDVGYYVVSIWVWLVLRCLCLLGFDFVGFLGLVWLGFWGFTVSCGFTWLLAWICVGVCVLDDQLENFRFLVS